MKSVWDFLILAVMGLLLFLAIGANNTDNNSGSESGTDSHSDTEQSNESKEPPKIYWGVDSALPADNNTRQCVQKSLGEPSVWGRYLGDIKNVSQGLDKDEVKALHKSNIHILLIYNHFSEAVGYDHGVQEAEKAISYADDLNAPDDVAIFGDVEPKFPVDSDFIEGWYDTLSASNYHAGLYGVFNKDSKLVEAFNATEDNVQNNIVLWTAYPQKTVTKKDNAPSYDAQGPKDASLYGWQYGTDSEQCTVDTNLFQRDMLDYLWKHGNES